MTEPTFSEIYCATDGGGSYEWDEVRVFRRHIDGALASDYQSGCSCNWYETPTADELEWVHSVSAILAKFAADLEHVYELTPVERAEHQMGLSRALSEWSGTDLS